MKRAKVMRCRYAQISNFLPSIFVVAVFVNLGDSHKLSPSQPILNSQSHSRDYSSGGSYYPADTLNFNYPQTSLLTGYDFGLVQLPTESPLTSAGDTGYNVSAYPPYFCRSTTARSHLDCPCLLIGLPCLQNNSICTADPNGDGFCACQLPGFRPLNGSCVTLAYYNQVVVMPYVISGPMLTASCFLPANAVLGTIPHVGGVLPISYNLTLLFSNFNGGDTRKFISIDAATGNIILLKPPRFTVLNQTYQVTARDATGAASSLIFKVAYNCTAPTCSVDVGSPVYVECQLSNIGSTIATILATGSVAPTRFSMVLSSSTSTLGNTYYQLDRFTGMIQILKALHGGIFSEVYNVTAENGVGQTCPTIQIKITTSADCT